MINSVDVSISEVVHPWSGLNACIIAVACPQKATGLKENAMLMEGIFQLHFPSDSAAKTIQKKPPIFSTFFFSGQEIKFVLKPGFPRCNVQFRRFQGEMRALKIPSVKFNYEVSTKMWVQEDEPPLLLDKLVAEGEEEARKRILLEEGNPNEVLKYGRSMLENVSSLKLSHIDSEERPACFPVWTEDRIKELERTHPVLLFERRQYLASTHTTLWMDYVRSIHHPDECDMKKCKFCKLLRSQERPGRTVKCTILQCPDCTEWKCFQLRDENCGGNCCGECLLCHEYYCLTTLRWWYNFVFLKRDNGQEIMQADGTLTQGVRRLKSLCVKGPRESGKTKWFQSLCKFLPHRVIHIKNKFNKDQFKHLKHAWLLLIDDFSYIEREDLQTIKPVQVAEPTVINVKWLSKLYEGGIPCVILCNEDKMFWSLYHACEDESQCKFLDLGDHIFLGPPKYQQPLLPIHMLPQTILPSVLRVHESSSCQFKQIPTIFKRKASTDLQFLEEDNHDDDEGDRGHKGSGEDDKSGFFLKATVIDKNKKQSVCSTCRKKLKFFENNEADKENILFQ